jgi:hypothetical protein
MKYRSLTMDIEGLHIELTGEGQLIIVSQRESIALVQDEWQAIIAAMMMRNWIGPCQLGRVSEESDTKVADYDNHPLATQAEF